MRAILETIQDELDKLRQVVENLRLNTEKNESELRQENTEVIRRLDTLCLSTEAIAKDERDRPQENTELARQLDTVRLNTETIAKKEDELARRLDAVCLKAEATAKTEEEIAQRLEALRVNTEAIAKNEYELRQENTELCILAEAGFLRFAVRIDAEDFRAFAAIMLTGNLNRAAETLQIPQSTLWNRVDAWPFRSTDYKRLHRMIEWRKKAGRKIKVRLDDSLLGTDVDEAENPETIRDVQAAMQDHAYEKSRDELLRDILQAIVSQNAENWQSVRAELIEILKDEVP